MKLYYSALSAECRKVRMVAAELALPLELVDAESLPRGREGDAHRHLAGPDAGARVPTLVDGEQVLRDANAIIRYLAERAPGSPLWPDNSALRADIARWQVWDALDFGPAVQRAVAYATARRTAARGAFAHSDYVNGLAWFHRFAGMLEAHLRERDFLVGDHATLADYSVVGTLSFADLVPLPLDRYVAVRRWRNLLEQRPPVRSIPVPTDKALSLAPATAKGPCHY